VAVGLSQVRWLLVIVQPGAQEYMARDLRRRRSEPFALQTHRLCVVRTRDFIT
jgi:hypothetical protein